MKRRRIQSLVQGYAFLLAICNPQRGHRLEVKMLVTDDCDAVLLPAKTFTEKPRYIDHLCFQKPSPYLGLVSWQSLWPMWCMELSPKCLLIN